MSEKTDIYPYQRLRGRKPKPKLVLPPFPKMAVTDFLKRAGAWDTVFLAVMSFFAGRAVLAGGLVPFPAALLASVMTITPDKTLWALAAGIGGLVTVSSGYSLGASVTTLMLLAASLSGTQGHFRQKWYGVPVLVTGLTIVVKVGIFAYFAPDMYNYIVVLFEGILAGCAAFLLIKFLPVLKKKGETLSLKKEEAIGGAVLVVAFLTGLSELSFEGIQLKNIFGRFLVLLAAYTGGSGFGAAMGTLVGMAPGITAAIAPRMVAVYSFSGLLSGMFRGFGRIGVCIGFILGNILLSIYLTDYSNLVTNFVETALAVALFMSIPAKRLFAARSIVKNGLFSFNARSVNEKRSREITAGKIRDYSRIFSELSRTFREISCDARTYEENNLQNLFNGIAAKVCKGCSLYRICWEKEFYKTYRSIMDMLAYIETEGRISEEYIPHDIQKRCGRLKEFGVTVNCLYETYKQAQVWQRKLLEGRDIVAGQLEGIASIMHNLSGEIKIDVRMREDIEIILRSELIKAGYNILDLSVIDGGNDQLEVKISCPSCGGKLECINGISPVVSRILYQPLTVLNSNYCTKKTGQPVCEFKLVPSRVFNVETGFASAAKDCSLISGDSYSTFDLKDGKFAVVLSDGMGVGPKASAESKATINLLEKLLESGFDTSLAAKTVNSILVLGSPDESFATVDLAILDLIRGVVELVKIGSAPSFIKRGNQVSMIRANSLPMGILHNIEVDTIQQSMGHDDVLVVVSDGVLNTTDGENHSESWILDILQDTITTDPQNIADMLLNRAIKKSAGIVDDDMTVIAVRLVSTNKSEQ